MTVSACLVTRNHAASLEPAIRTARRIASEVIVVDTGSADETVARAGRLGAAVCPVAWADDFAEACNAALTRATGAWVLWLNPDEELDPAAGQALQSVVASTAAFAARVRVQQELKAEQRGYGTIGWDLRLFRRDPAVRFVGRLHPSFVTPVEQLAVDRQQIVVTTDAVIRRKAYLSEATPDKVRWVVRLLEAELRDRPGQLPYLIELGRNLLRLNDPHGHEVLANASDILLASADHLLPPTPVAGELLEYLLSVSPEQSRSRIAREQARELAGRWFPMTPPVVWAVAGERFAAGDYPAAVDHLARLLEMGRTGLYDGSASFSPDILGPSARLNLGLCYRHLGRWREARDCFGQLLSDPTYRERAARLYADADRVVRGTPPSVS